MPDIARPGLDAGDEVGDLGELIDLLYRRPAWHADALCREYPDVDFFPGRGRDTKTPCAICQRCLVLSECRSWALDQGPLLQGIWGGMTGRERERQRRGGEAA